MNRLLFFVVCLFATFSAQHVFSAANNEHQKVYVAPEQLKIDTDGIFIHFDEVWYKTDSLFSDGQGIYVHARTEPEMGCRKGFFPCRNCDRCVKWYYDICPHCSKPTLF
jgi:hypothetical protein